MTVGLCPALTALSWSAGLSASHQCVLLQLTDGGGNDSDGLVNGSVADPGAVSLARAVPEPPTPPENRSQSSGGSWPLGALIMLGLALLTKASVWAKTRTVTQCKRR